MERSSIQDGTDDMPLSTARGQYLQKGKEVWVRRKYCRYH